jgi:hypothetical protein
VQALPERQVPGGRTADVEAVGVLERGGIAVGGADQEQHARAARHRDVPDLGVPQRVPDRELDR